MSRRGQTNARTPSYSRRVPIPPGDSAPLATDRDDRGSTDRPLSSSSVAVVRESASLVSCVPALAPQLPEITSPRCGSPFSSYSFPFFPSSFPLSPRAAPHADLLPLSRPVLLFFPLLARLIPLSSPSRFRHPRFAALRGM